MRSATTASRSVHTELERVEMMPVSAPSIHTLMALLHPNTENAMAGIARPMASRGIERLRLKDRAQPTTTAPVHSGMNDAAGRRVGDESVTIRCGA